MTSRTLESIAAVVGVLVFPAVASTQTLADMVRENGRKPVIITGNIDAPRVSVVDLSKHCDLIVVGSLVKKDSYIGSERLFVYTDYVLSPERILLRRPTAAPTSPGPAQTPPLTITLYGGEVVVDGVPVTIRDGSRLAPIEGKRLLLFLTRNSQKPNNYTVYGNTGGIFELGADGRLKSVSAEHGNAEVDNLSIDEFALKLGKR